MSEDEKKPMKEMRMRIKLDDATAKGTYANTSFVHHNETEFVLDFIYAEPARGEGLVVSRVITNPRAAKQLALGLSALVSGYEKKFGEIALSRMTRPVDPGNYN